jgi:hypothetical protein
MLLLEDNFNNGQNIQIKQNFKFKSLKTWINF